MKKKFSEKNLVEEAFFSILPLKIKKFSFIRNFTPKKCKNKNRRQNSEFFFEILSGESVRGVC